MGMACVVPSYRDLTTAASGTRTRFEGCCTRSAMQTPVSETRDPHRPHAAGRRGTHHAAKALVVETDPQLIGLLEPALRREGYEVLFARDGIEALRIVRVERPDLVILDIMLTWLGASRAAHHAAGPAIIALRPPANAANATPDGADAYVTKPVQLDELLARVRHVRRRSASVGVLQAGPVVMDLLHWSVRVDDVPVVLAAKEFRLLRKLLEANGRVLTRDTLLESVWGHDGAQRVETRTLDVHVGRLRRKLGAAGRFIVTVRGLGYRFMKL
jgi:two-component system phosphate regulon response regulator PhoB